MNRFCRRSKRKRAMTLLEVILSMSLLVVLSSMTYWFYFTSLSSKARGIERASDLRLMRTVLRRISEEIRQAVVQTGDFGVGITGGREAIEITTLRVPRRDLARQRSTQELPAELEYDLVKVQYKIARHPDILHDDGWEQPLGLARVEQRIPRRLAARRASAGEADSDAEKSAKADEFSRELLGLPTDSGEGSAIAPEIDWEELYAPDIHYIRFCYYDGYSWWDDWHIVGDNSLPQLIQMTIGFGDHPPLEGPTGEGAIGDDDINEQYCACLNKEPSDCERLAVDEYSIVVRVPRADPLFRSRVSRESQSLAQELLQGELEGEEGGS